MRKPKIFARYGFYDQIIPLRDAMTDEICSCDSYLIGYEDEDGRECDGDGNYLGKNPNQTHVFFE